MSPKSDLASFAEGTGFLSRRPSAVLGLAALGMALGALPPLLQILCKLPNDDFTGTALTFVALLPLEMYLIPRFLAEADAFRGGSPQNPYGEWEKHFEARWLKSMAGKVLLSMAIGLGVLCFILPGLMLLFAFGWMPLRVLLRGEGLADACRGSLRMMIPAWRRVLGVALPLVIVNLAMLMVLFWASGSQEQHPAPLAQLTHPRVWVINFVSILMNLWTSACLLALFRRVESAA